MEAVLPTSLVGFQSLELVVQERMMGITKMVMANNRVRPPTAVALMVVMQLDANAVGQAQQPQIPIAPQIMPAQQLALPPPITLLFLLPLLPRDRSRPPTLGQLCPYQSPNPVPLQSPRLKGSPVPLTTSTDHPRNLRTTPTHRTLVEICTIRPLGSLLSPNTLRLREALLHLTATQLLLAMRPPKRTASLVLMVHLGAVSNKLTVDDETSVVA